MKTITFYSYKGGVGRSLALSNIATRLSEIGKKVCIIDFDLDAPGLQFKFADYSSPKIEKGLVDYIHRYAIDSIAEKKIKSFSVQLTPLNKALLPITFIPAGNIDSDDYWKKLSMIPWSKLFYSEEGEGIDFFLDLKAKIEEEFNPDFLLIDSRTGITDISAITLKIFADEVVVLAANNEENLFGCKRILKNLYDPHQALFGIVPKVNFLLTRLPVSEELFDNEKRVSRIEEVRQSIMAELDIDHFDYMIIHSDSSLEIEERKLIGYEYQKGVSIGNDYLKLFDMLTADVIGSDEINKFNQARAAEREFTKGQQAEDNLIKITHFTNAINLDPTNSKYYISRGLVYSNAEYWDLSIMDFKKAVTFGDMANILSINIGYCYMQKKDFQTALNYLDQSDSLKAIIMKISILLDLNKDEDAMRLITFVLDLLPENHETLNTRANIYRKQNDFDKAYQDIYKALELSPENPVYFATLAEIFAMEGKLNEFYLTLSVAFSFGLSLKSIVGEKEIYTKFLEDSRLIALLELHNLDIDELKDELNTNS